MEGSRQEKMESLETEAVEIVIPGAPSFPHSRVEVLVETALDGVGHEGDGVLRLQGGGPQERGFSLPPHGGRLCPGFSVDPVGDKLCAVQLCQFCFHQLHAALVLVIERGQGHVERHLLDGEEVSSDLEGESKDLEQEKNVNGQKETGGPDRDGL